MGVFIQGVDIPVRSKKPQSGVRTYCLSGFERSLLTKEKTYRDYDKDPCSSHCIGIPYSSYNELRELMCYAFLKTTPDKVWQRCSFLKPNQTYGRNLYHLINFADNEGYIGPTAVKKIAKYLTNRRVKKAMNRIPKDQRGLCLELIDTIKETATMHRGYLVFS